VYVERAGSRPLWSVSLRGNHAVVPIVLSTLATLAAAILIPAISQALHLSLLPWTTAVYAAGLGAIAVLWTQPFYAWKAMR
jgi:hypothetical protein